MIHGIAKINIDGSCHRNDLPPENYSKCNPLLQALQDSKFEFTLTGSRALGWPGPDSDWDFVAHVDGLTDYDKYSELTRFLDSLDGKILRDYNEGFAAKITRMGSYEGAIEGGSDHNLQYVYRLELGDGRKYNSVDIQIVSNYHLRLRQIEFFRTHFVDWAALKESKTANVVWNLSESIVSRTPGYRAYLRRRYIGAWWKNLIHMNGLAITFGNFNEGPEKDPMNWWWAKDGKFKQHDMRYERRITWRFAYWWLNTFHASRMEPK